MSDNRIGSACWYKSRKFWRLGHLRMWSTNHVECENGPAPFPVAVVEDDKTMICDAIPVFDVCFAATPPGPVENRQ